MAGDVSAGHISIGGRFDEAKEKSVQIIKRRKGSGGEGERLKIKTLCSWFQMKATASW